MGGIHSMTATSLTRVATHAPPAARMLCVRRHRGPRRSPPQ